MKVMEDLGKDQTVQKSHVQEKHTSMAQAVMWSTAGIYFDTSWYYNTSHKAAAREWNRNQVGRQTLAVLNWCIPLASQM